MDGLAFRTKLLLDRVAAALGLLVLAPVLGSAALAILLEDGGPVLFRQRRVGRLGREYDVLKLRTMRLHPTAADEMGQVREDHVLVTRSGRILRRLKIDELPQLWNVLRGEMSLVGPRPTLASQVAAYGAFERRRLLHLPGLTGWAQVNGNTLVSWRERIEMDVWYVDHWSLVLDLRIFLATIGVVLRGERPNAGALELARAHADRSGRGG